MHTPTLKKVYLETIVPEMMKTRGYANRHEVPALEKIIVNSGVNSKLDRAAVEETAKELAIVCGQKPIVTHARSSVSNFKVRQAMPVGVKTTLRGKNMYEFLYRLVNIALPVIRDFRGLPVKMDGHGNYTIGITDHTIFPEIVMDTTKRSIGMDITIVTTAKTDEEGRELLEKLGMPFRKKQL